MSKRKLDVIYNDKLTKKELHQKVKQEIIDMYNSLKECNFSDNVTKEDLNKITTLFSQIDNKGKDFIKLFLLSLFCSYFFSIRNKINIYNDHDDLYNECFTKYNFVFLDINDTHKTILKDLVVYFNTDATNLHSITGQILNTLNNIDVQIQQIKKQKT